MAASDPFTKLRGQKPAAVLEEVDDSEPIVKYRFLYEQCAVDTTINEIRAKGGDPIQQYLPTWKSDLTNAVLKLPEFQEVLVNEYHCPDLYDFSTMVFEEDWMLSIYLAGFYDCFAADEDEAALNLVRDAMREAANEAKDLGLLWLKKYSYQILEGLQQDTVGDLPPLPPNSQEPLIALLLRVAQHEKHVNEQRSTLERGINLVPELSSKPSANAVITRLQTYQNAETTIDKYGAQAMEILYSCTKVPEFQSISSMNTVRDFVEKAGDLQNTAAEGSEVEAEAAPTMLDAELEGQEQGDEAESFDKAPEQSFIQSMVDDKQTIYYPFRTVDEVTCFTISKTAKALARLKTWKKGKGKASKVKAPKAKSRQAKRTSNDERVETEALPDLDLNAADLVNLRSVAKRVVRRWTGFTAGRALSQEEWKQLESKLDTKDTLIKSCVDYIKSNPMDDVASKAYHSSLLQLSAVKERGDIAANAERDYKGFVTFSPVQLVDNWWHCRNYLAALAVVCDLDPTTPPVAQCELELAMLLSMIRVGADDPLSWVLVVDYSLRKMWRQLPQEKRRGAFVLGLFEELVTFAHGAVVNAFVLRCQKRYCRPDAVLHEWYPLLHEYNPRCNNLDCLALLPDPSVIDIVSVRGMFSFGTLEARVGKRGIRAMVSSNRNHAFNCLYYITRYFAPKSELVVLIFWYSSLYHNEVCKTARGKPSITAFA